MAKYRITKDESGTMRSFAWPFVVEKKVWIFDWCEYTRFEEQYQAEAFIDRVLNPRPNKIIKEF